jgi:hypothetical protein
LGKNIAALRDAAGLTQAQLGEAMGVGQYDKARAESAHGVGGKKAGSRDLIGQRDVVQGSHTPVELAQPVVGGDHRDATASTRSSEEYFRSMRALWDVVKHAEAIAKLSPSLPQDVGRLGADRHHDAQRDRGDATIHRARAGGRKHRR